MIKVKNEQESHPIEIDLDSPQGNAFYLIGLAKKLSKSMNLNFPKIEGEMTSSDYENLIKVFDNYFGHVVILYK